MHPSQGINNPHSLPVVELRVVSDPTLRLITHALVVRVGEHESVLIANGLLTGTWQDWDNVWDHAAAVALFEDAGTLLLRVRTAFGHRYENRPELASESWFSSGDGGLSWAEAATAEAVGEPIVCLSKGQVNGWDPLHYRRE